FASAANAAQASVQLKPCAYCITLSSGVALSASSATASLKGAFSISSRGCAELLANGPNCPSSSCSLVESGLAAGSGGAAGGAVVIGVDGADGVAGRCFCQRW